MRAKILIGLLAVVGCSDVATEPTQPLPATDLAAAVLPVNALGAAVTFKAPRAQMARVRYWHADAAVPIAVNATPTVRIAAHTPELVRLVILGLTPNSTYKAVVETISNADTAESDTVTFIAGALPPALAHVQFRLTEGVPTHGYTLTGVRSQQLLWAVAFDSTGSIAWYRGFDVGLLGFGEIKQQANGDFTMFLGATFGWQPTAGYYVQFRPDGDVVATYQAPPPLYTDNHELLLTFKDSVLSGAIFFGYELRRTDLSGAGGPADTLFAYHRILRWTPDSGPTPIFKAEQIFTFADIIEPPRLPPSDFAHPNSIDVDDQGNYIVSWRNMGEVTAFNPQSGDILWRLGGTHSTFQFVSDPLGGFSGQHCARMVGHDQVLMFDNGLRHIPPQTRAVEYLLDRKAGTATLVWQFSHPRGLFTQFAGCAQRLSNDNTLLTFAGDGTITEVNPDGHIVAEGIVENAGQTVPIYRSVRINSLYRRE